MEVEDANDLDDAIVELLQGLQEDGERLEDVQVLTPRKDVAGGTNHLNAAMQHAFNPRGQLVIKHPWQQLRVGDRVIQTKNNYRIGVFNGEVGFIPDHVGPGVVVAYEKLEKPQYTTKDHELNTNNYYRYTVKDAEELLLAYAITVHRGQGSQWPIVVVVCHSDHSNMLTRQLLYTAVTRTQKRLFIVGDKAGLSRALRTDRDTSRRTLLVSKIREAV
jgi:exodeoxyribonuclease V alpha subunit